MGLYRPLLQIEVEHTFFPADVCRGLRYTLTEASARLLDRAGCLVRETDRGLLLLHDSADTAALRALTRLAHEPFLIHWLVRASDALFANYTASATHTPRPLLVLDPTRHALARAAGLPPLPADHLDTEADLARLGSPWLCPLLSRHERLLPPDFTLSVVVTAADIAAAAQHARQLVCCLQARATVWKYCLIGNWADAQDAEQVQVVDLAQAWQFDAAVDERLANGQVALAVRSKASIPLQQRSDRRFQLRQRSGGTDKVLIKRLPVASARQLSRDAPGGLSTLVSEIYVHR